MEPHNVPEVLARISQYTGRRAINRYRFLADAYPSLALYGYEGALREIVRSTWDIQQYKLIHNAYNKVAASHNLPLIPEDESWIQNTQAEMNQTFSRLEMELKNYTTSLMKESIRITYQDLAARHRLAGDQNNALRALSKAREHCSNSAQVAEISFALLELAMDCHAQKSAENYIGKAEGALEATTSSKENKQDGGSKAKASTSYAGASTSGTSAADAKEKERVRLTERLNIAKGLSALGQGNFMKAASAFLRVSREAGQYPGTELLITQVDLAIYTTLCAMATFTRPELKKKVIDNAELRSLLECEPQLKRVLYAFQENKHREVLQFLDDWQPTYRTDMYLAHHINVIIYLIQERAILQYFSPFSSVALAKASEAFGWSEVVLKERLLHSIASKKLHAKIDLPNGLLIANQNDSRVDLFQKAIESADAMELESKAALLRLMLIQANVVVKDHQSANQPETLRGKQIGSGGLI
ncbi:hypothetical protein CROQUDRAFT_75476 [Cronartium quercuum f. sp. fusiforme G11]|uniref:PCI domain-containing protein n=1 Tax=Cronartium quercuum f. sp. fusiforme G11 TaxID=708437 RepID=A0A9P6NQK2_9BASI|nr:hypothetical protein CROQUDRAFT_75476 [Cronartium quercuum f. sp. fusiforme G11]